VERLATKTKEGRERLKAMEARAETLRKAQASAAKAT
jgi:hypothetical protein